MPRPPRPGRPSSLLPGVRPPDGRAGGSHGLDGAVQPPRRDVECRPDAAMRVGDDRGRRELPRRRVRRRAARRPPHPGRDPRRRPSGAAGGARGRRRRSAARGAVGARGAGPGDRDDGDRCQRGAGGRGRPRLRRDRGVLPARLCLRRRRRRAGLAGTGPTWSGDAVRGGRRVDGRGLGGGAGRDLARGPAHRPRSGRRPPRPRRGLVVGTPGPPIPATLTTVPAEIGSYWTVLGAGVGAVLAYLLCAIALGVDDLGRPEA